MLLAQVYQLILPNVRLNRLACSTSPCDTSFCGCGCLGVYVRLWGRQTLVSQGCISSYLHPAVTSLLPFRWLSLLTMTFEVIILICGLSYLSSTALRYLEDGQLWTLRLWLSLMFPVSTFTVLSCAAGASLVSQIYTSTALNDEQRRLAIAATSIALVTLFIKLFLPLLRSRGYVDVRWKAWTGLSRTGISSQYVRYLGDQQDWQSMHASCGTSTLHPVETGIGLLAPLSTAFSEDATDVLKATAASSEDVDVVWVPRSDRKIGVYQPVEQDQPVSLLWGRNLGFKPRCSRGIISIPRNLLKYNPLLKNGVDGKPLCLAHGILARTKGLAPQSLVCNLQRHRSYRIFEENSIFWPRPAKTHRSLYLTEMSRSYSGLGEDYISAATELALLLADVSHGLVSDWLDGIMEHQDLSLNNEVAGLGGSPKELQMLYRGSYAAMLVSLSLHRIGERVRPELAVFRALWRLEELDSFPVWLEADSMVRRDQEETTLLGENGARLIQAII